MRIYILDVHNAQKMLVRLGMFINDMFNNHLRQKITMFIFES